MLDLQRHENDLVRCTHCCVLSPKAYCTPPKMFSPVALYRERFGAACCCGAEEMVILSHVLPRARQPGEHVEVVAPRFGPTDQSLKLLFFFQRKT